MRSFGKKEKQSSYCFYKEVYIPEVKEYIRLLSGSHRIFKEIRVTMQRVERYFDEKFQSTLHQFHGYTDTLAMQDMSRVLSLCREAFESISIGSATPPTSKHHEDEDKKVQLKDATEEDMKVRYPILTLNKNSTRSTDFIANVLLTTNEALEKLEHSDPGDGVVTNARNEISLFIQTILVDCGYNLEKLWDLQRTVRYVVTRKQASPLLQKRKATEIVDHWRKKVRYNEPYGLADSKREASSLMGTLAPLASLSRSGENTRTPADGCYSKSQSQKQNPAPDPAIVLQRKKIREAMGPKYVQLLVLAKGLEDILPRYPDLESLIMQPFYEERKLCELMEEDEEAVLAKVNVIRTELGTYEDKLLEAFEKLQAHPGEEQPQNLSEEKKAKQKPLQLLSQAELREKLRSICQGARRKTLLESSRGCQELWKQYERECESLCPDGMQFEVQDSVSALTKTRGHLSTRLQAVSEAARRSCLLKERVELVSSQTDWLCEQLTSPDMTADLPSCRVRFLRVFQRLLFLTGVCSQMAQ